MHILPGDGVGEGKTDGAKELRLQPEGLTEAVAGFAAILGIAQNGVAHMGAVEPKLMGPPGDGPQSKFT